MRDVANIVLLSIHKLIKYIYTNSYQKKIYVKYLNISEERVQRQASKFILNDYEIDKEIEYANIAQSDEDDKTADEDHLLT